MKNKILLCALIIVIMAIIIIFGYTNARYYSTASMTGDLDYVKTIGEISIYQPGWVGGYKDLNGKEPGPDDGSGYFDVPQVPTDYASIHYKVTNKVDGEINEEEVLYYIRIVAEDGSKNIPIEYNVHEYNTPNNVLNLEKGVGYGPFTLSATSEEEKYYSIRANYTSKDSAYATSEQHLKVQMIKKRIDGTLKVIDDAPLNMKYTGSKTRISFAYYLYGTKISVGTTQTLDMEDNFTIDFKNSVQLTDLGITLPDEYEFHDVRGILPGYVGNATSVVIPEGYHLDGYWIEVYLISNTKVALQLDYYDYTNYTTDENGNRNYNKISDKEQILVVNRGTEIDFTNEEQRKELGINLPIGYTLQGLDDGAEGNLVTNKYTDKSIIIPNTTTDALHYIEVYMNPSGSAVVNLSYYDFELDSSKLLNTQTLSSVSVGTKIDFKSSSSLSSIGITLPTDYKFKTAYCTELDNTGIGQNAFTIPYNGKGKTYNINVVLDKVIETITVPVKFYNSSGTEVKSTTVNMKSDGTYDFTTEICRTLCPELNAMTSFTIYIANQWGSTYDNVGNTSTTASVTVDYNATYTSWADFRLTDEGSYIYIKAWW